MSDGRDGWNELAAAYLDGTLSDEQRLRFERLMRENPAALQRVGEAVRFDVELRDALNPDHIELIEQRRMVIDRVTGKPVLVETSQRVAQRGEWKEPAKPAQGKKFGWLPLIALLVIAGATAVFLTRKRESEAPANMGTQPAWQAIPVRNADFEKIETTPEGTIDFKVMPNWQDKFSTYNASLTDHDAHSGTIAAQMKPGGHIKQLLERSEGVPLNFEPGMKVKVSGWIKLVKPPAEKSNALRADLHFVDEQKRQYAVNYDLLAFTGGDWQMFSVEFTVPEQAKFLPAWFRDVSKDEAQGVRGRQVLLSLYNDTISKSFETDMLIDDVKVEWLPVVERK